MYIQNVGPTMIIHVLDLSIKNLFKYCKSKLLRKHNVRL